ncbi:MAG TPA: hypothetical protein VJA26_13940, partial [Gammaproteobacteria bacterium]|nr:hypothetical protein [Gammaproteobacteria bacterium]
SSLSDLAFGQAANSKTACEFLIKYGMKTVLGLQQAREQAENVVFTGFFFHFLRRRFCIRSLSALSPTNF